MPNTILERLRSLHPSHKIKIIAGVGAIVLVGLTSAWTSSVKQKLANIDSAPIEQAGSVLSASNHITLESSELKDQRRYVYFKVLNPTADILNFSKPENITFQHKSGATQIFSLTDRQQSTFPQKILSNTTVYGVAVFEETSVTEGNIIFDNLFFENSPSVMFKESIFVDFDTLKTIQELRS
jgi:hypothetical protein